MAIFLKILAILGWTLLGVLGLIVLILLLVLLVPIRYQLEAKKAEEIEAVGAVHWLLHLVSIRVQYDAAGLCYVVRVLGIPVKRSDQDTGQKAKGKPKGKAQDEASGPSEDGAPENSSEQPDSSEQSDKSNEQSDRSNEQPETDAFKTREEKAESGVKDKASEETVSEKAETGARDAEEAKTGDDDTSGLEGAAENKAEAGSEKAPEEEDADAAPAAPWYRKLMQKLGDLWDTVRCMYYLFRGRVELLQEYLSKESTKKAFSDVLRVLVWILRHIAPRKLSGAVEFGSADPAVTGYATAGAAAFLGVYGERFTFTPNFEEECIRGTVAMKGRIRLMGFVYHGIRLVLDKNLKRVISQTMEVKDRMLETVPELKRILGKEV